ncbi:MAG: putative 4-hydroxybenzoate polyprenyltransferase [Acidobacteria bacterium]|nr:putative 4-hydroxybenzoate polyprenyltransferase [Acidobacteriota bacterium]
MTASAIRYVRSCFSLVRFGHAVFAIPFALVGALLAAEQHPLTLARVGWIVAAMVTARTAAMGFNRLVDARYDALNPRTANRELPRGVLSRGDAIGLVAVSSVAFVLVTTQLGWICLVLSPLALAIVFWYSLAKRFTTWTQMYLGLALAVAPVGGWLAAGGRGGWEPWLLALAIGTWVAGFDILYSCQDLEFDRANGLRSIPVRFGVGRSLVMARWLHVGTVAAMAAVALAAPLGAWYLAGVGGVAALLAWEQSLVRADDLSRVKQAFDLNGYVGLFYLAATAVALHAG